MNNLLFPTKNTFLLHHPAKKCSHQQKNAISTTQALKKTFYLKLCPKITLHIRRYMLDVRRPTNTQVLYLWYFALFRNSTFSPLSPHFFDLKISRYFETPCLKVTKKKVLKNIYF